MTIKQIIFRISITILIIEALIMWSFSILELDMTIAQEALFDAFLLVLFSTPIIYIWIIKPFVVMKDEAIGKISYLTYYDEPTGLPNKTKLLDWLDYSIKTSINKKETISIILFDIDRFKTMHDTLGHEITDKIIIQVSQKVKDSIGNEAILTRISSSSFALLVEHTVSNDALYLLSKKILSELALPIECDNRTFNIGASIGISSYPKDAANKEDLLKYAHTAMRQAKTNEDEKINFYTQALTAMAHKHFSLEEDIRRAIENDEFFLTYQPKINAQTNKLMGVEALIRWQHPKKGIINPNDFIQFAENSGQITDIGEWVINEAVRQQEEWQSDGKEPIMMSINLSGRQLKEERVEYIIDILNTSLTPKKYIEFEITETYLMKKPEQSQILLEKLQKTGISLAMDDFGTGYSSLGYLKRFQIDVLKIDKILIDDIERDNNDFAIVKAIIAMAHTIGIKVVAEGVETKEQVNMLKDIECDYFQGFYFSKPVDAESVYSNDKYII